MTALLACALALGMAVACARGPIELGFWLEPVSYSSPRIGNPISPAELARIDAVARAEIVSAFAPYGVVVSANRAARYSVRVVPALKDERLIRGGVVAGSSRGIGRVAIHELLHQLFPSAPLHDSRDPQSYEGNSPAQIEGYVGELHWGLAAPLLEQRPGKR